MQKIKEKFKNISGQALAVFGRRNFKLAIGASALLILIALAGWHYLPRWYKEYKYRTRFYAADAEGLKPLPEAEVRGKIGDYCAKRRAEAAKVYTATEMAEAVKTGSGTIEMIGAAAGDNPPGAADQAGGYLILDIAERNIKLECFNFNRRLAISGAGRIDIGYSEFKNSAASAIGLNAGAGAIHHNIISGAAKAGISAEAGEYEIYLNVIKDNLSYGVYGGYGAQLRLHENAIAGNGGYEVRLMKNRAVYE